MPDRIRTYDLLLRKQTLYPAELRAHTNFDDWADNPLGVAVSHVDALINRDIHLENINEHHHIDDGFYYNIFF